MARLREFDTDIALAKAMDVFWKCGYEDATLPDLLEGMNLSRGSLYKAFKDKKALFLIVLCNYDEQAVSDAVSLLTNTDQDGWDRIFSLFDSITDLVESGDRRGCLLCSAIAGPAAYDPDIAALAFKSIDRMAKAFEQAIEASAVPNDAASVAQLLVTQYVGLRMVSRTNIPATKIKQTAQALRRFATPSNGPPQEW